MELTKLLERPGLEFDVTATSDDLADLVDKVRITEQTLRNYRELIGLELLRRMDKSAKWTIQTPQYTVTAPSPDAAITEEWDIERLRDLLADLQDEGVIDADAADAALEVSFSYKVRAAGIKNLRKLGPEIAQLIDECATEVPKNRRVSVKLRLPK